LDLSLSSRRGFFPVSALPSARSCEYSAFLLILILFNTPFLYNTLGTAVFQTVERKVYDILLRVRGEREHSNDVVLVRIDEYTINKMNNEYPLPRDQVGAAMTILSTYGAKAVALDIFVPPSPKDSVENALMAEYLAHAENTFQAIGAFIPSDTDPSQISRRDVDSTAHFVIGRFGIPAPPFHHFPRSPFIDDYPFPELADVSTGVGHTTLILDTLDGIMRSAPLFVEYAGQLYPALGLALALHELDIPLESIRFTPTDEGTYVRAGAHEILSGLRGEILINFIGPERQVFSAERGNEFALYDILDAYQRQDEQFLSQFAGKVCIIGPTARSVGDYYSMPFSEGAPGFTAHANIYDTIINQMFIYRADGVVQIVLLFLVIFAVGLVATLRRTRVAVMTAVALAVLYSVFAYFAFANGNMIYNLAEPLFGIALTFGVTLAYRAATEGKQRKMITGMFERYVDKTVVQQLIDNPSMLKLGGETMEITLLFSDVKGFTGISEQMTPAQLVKLVNSYLTEMANIIMKNLGTVDKFIGDAIMAFWGAPLEDPDGGYNACVAALEMKRRLEALQTKWKKFGEVEIKQRVGINTGMSIVGNMGSESKFNYTAIGDAVNLASRLEGVNKQYGTDILLSEFTYQKIAKRILAREIDRVQVVGRTEPVRIYELMGLASGKLSDNLKNFLDLYRDGLIAYQERRWDEGIAYFEAAQSYMPNDPVSQLYIERLKLYKLHPPGESWDGVFVLTSK